MHTVQYHYTFIWGQVSAGCLATATMQEDLYRRSKEMCFGLSRCWQVDYILITGTDWALISTFM